MQARPDKGNLKMSITIKSKFCLGQLVSTPGALEALQRNYVSGFTYVRRHAAGDWGELSEEDALLNDQAAIEGGMILSAYRLPDQTRIWVISDGSVDQKGTRQTTTLLLPEEY